MKSLREIKVVTVLMIVGFIPSHVIAQTGDSLLKNFIYQVRLSYDKAAYLSFNVHYYYANKSQPEKYMDSLSGEVEIDKKRTRYRMDGIETIETQNYNIQIRPDEKTMFIAKENLDKPYESLVFLDTVLSRIHGIKTSVSRKNQYETISISFPPGQSYLNVLITRSLVNGYLTSIVYELNTESFVGKDQIDKPGHPGLYQPQGKVEMRFTNYATNRFGETVFNESNYFIKNGLDYQPVGKYAKYSINFLPSNQ